MNEVTKFSELKKLILAKKAKVVHSKHTGGSTRKVFYKIDEHVYSVYLNLNQKQCDFVDMSELGMI